MKPNDLVQGTLGLLILRILALEPMHGWALAQRLKQMSKDVLQVGPGSLYPALHKLEQEGWIKAEWLMSDTRRRVKFYSISKKGRKQAASNFDYSMIARLRPHVSVQQADESDFEAYQRTWVHDLQVRLARLSGRGKRIVVPDAGHDIPSERPDAIVNAVRELREATSQP